MRIDVLGDMFPETQITAIPYSMGSKREQEIEKEYKNLATELDYIRKKEKGDKKGILPQIIRAHQKIEILKIPTFVELANDFIYNGFSVVIFVNFTKTLETLGKLLHTDAFIYGEQKQEKREIIIDNFQNNKINLIICNIKAGGIGISLHDMYGGHPRATIFSPTWSSIDLLQALGRVHRAGGKSKSLQRIVYTANTIEEKISDKLKKKIKDINSINNGDLDLSNIVFDNKIQKM
jgi:SNF2 family DNA or RNA helicase